MRAAPKVAAAAQTNLDEYDGGAVTHDQIELSVTTAIVSVDQSKTSSGKKLESEILALLSEIAGKPAIAGH